MWVLLGIAVIVVGFMLRFNPLLVVAISALVTGLAAGIDGLEVLAAFGPSAVAAGESYGAYGGLRLPDGTFEKRFRICRDGDSGECRNAGWGSVSGPGEWWGYFGQLKLEPGRYRVGLTLYAPYGPDGARAVGQVSWRVDAR